MVVPTHPPSRVIADAPDAAQREASRSDDVVLGVLVLKPSSPARRLIRRRTHAADIGVGEDYAGRQCRLPDRDSQPAAPRGAGASAVIDVAGLTP